MIQTFYIDIAKENIDNVIRFFSGDNHTVNIYVKNDGAILDLTGYTAILSVKENLNDDDYALQLFGSAVSYNTSKGLITFSFDSADTENLEAGEYYYDVQITGSNTYTLVCDTLDLKADITKNSYFYLGHERGIRRGTEDGKYLITESINLT